MQPFSYFAPRSLAEASELLRDADARVLAGGSDLIVQMRSGRVRPARIVDVKHIPELRVLAIGAREAVIGAAVAAAEIRENAELARIWPGLSEAIALIGSRQIQGRATVGGNLCNASPAADSVPALCAAGAHATIAGPAGTRSVAVEVFVEAPGKTVLRPGEILVDLRVPRPAARSADAYLRLIPRSEMDIAVVGAGVALELDASGRCSAARVALGAVAPTVLLAPDAARALVGSALDAAALARAGAAASAACQPIDDKRGTAEYRRKVAGVLVRRAAAIAASRARER